jgi:hypothetical protein
MFAGVDKIFFTNPLLEFYGGGGVENIFQDINISLRRRKGWKFINLFKVQNTFSRTSSS